MNKNIALLIVEDELELAKALEDISKKIVPNTYLAANGEEALVMLKSHPEIIAIISDIHMPKMTGLELLRTLRSEYNAIPFVVLTAYGSPQTMREAVQMNATDFIDKPFNLKEMSLVMKRAVQYGKSLKLLENKIEELYKNSDNKNIQYIKRMKRTTMAMRIESAVYLGKQLKKPA